MPQSQLINSIFDKLDQWRNLPSYQLERRADIFFAVYLSDIFKARFSLEIDFLIPEFPVRLGDVFSDKKLDKPNLSFKIDYLAVSNASKTVFLIELKTDNGSRRDKQDFYLEKAKKNGVKILIDGVLEISNASVSKKKYGNLIKLLSEMGWVNQHLLTNTVEDYNIQIVYIQPTNPGNTDKTIITFKEISEYLAEKQDFMTQRFIQSLQKWIQNPNS